MAGLRTWQGWGATAVLLFVVLAAIVGPHLVQIGQVGPLTNPADFRAFYCAGEVVAHGADPYLIEPLRSCEVRATREMGLTLLPALVVPAPLPPYGLALFAAISRLPFVTAVCGWFALLLAATIALAIALRRDTGAPIGAIVAIVATCAFNAMLLGQIMPTIAILIVIAARAVAKKRIWLAAVCLSLAMIEPHVALPAYLAAFFFSREMRLPLVACTAALIVPSLLLGGPHAYLEYFSRELPLHAISETHALQAQYSLTTFLVMGLGFADTLALRLGELDYAITIALSLFVAKRLSDRLEDPRVLLYIPPAFAVLGGMYDHLYAFVIVIPAALALAVRFKGIRASFCWFAAIAIALSTALDEFFSEDLAHHVLPARDALAALGPDRYASEVSRLFETVRMPDDPHAIAAIVAIKLPAIAGVLAFVLLATAAALSRHFLTNFMAEAERPGNHPTRIERRRLLSKN